MIYIDTSVALAELLAEDRKPDAAIWAEPLISSHLLVYELWTRFHALRLGEEHQESARDLLARTSLIEMTSSVLRRATEPFPVPVRTLDALHLASIDFLRERGLHVRLATFDERMRKAARAMKIPLCSV